MSRPAPRKSGLGGRSPALPPQPDLEDTTTGAGAGSTDPATAAATARALTPRPQRARSTKRIPEGKVQLTAYIPADVRAEARGAAKVLMGAVEGPNNLSELVAEAIEEKLERLRKEFNGGRPFEPAQGPLPSGPTPGA